jgi:hypothetical protein
MNAATIHSLCAIVTEGRRPLSYTSLAEDSKRPSALKAKVVTTRVPRPYNEFRSRKRLSRDWDGRGKQVKRQASCRKRSYRLPKAASADAEDMNLCSFPNPRHSWLEDIAFTL